MASQWGLLFPLCREGGRQRLTGRQTDGQTEIETETDRTTMDRIKLTVHPVYTLHKELHTTKKC